MIIGAIAAIAFLYIAIAWKDTPLLKANDWKEVYMSSSTYDTWNTIKGIKVPGSEDKQKCIAVLLYSKARDKYKIEGHGFIPSTGLESSNAYQECLAKQIELQNGKDIK